MTGQIGKTEQYTRDLEDQRKAVSEAAKEACEAGLRVSFQYRGGFVQRLYVSDEDHHVWLATTYRADRSERIPRELRRAVELYQAQQETV